MLKEDCVLNTVPYIGSVVIITITNVCILTLAVLVPVLVPLLTEVMSTKEEEEEDRLREEADNELPVDDVDPTLIQTQIQIQCFQMLCSYFHSFICCSCILIVLCLVLVKERDT